MAWIGDNFQLGVGTNSIKITHSENAETYTVYSIEVISGPFRWTVKRRYSEFHDLNEQLVNRYNFEKNVLPPKKLLGNQNPGFIQKRLTELEEYLVRVVSKYQRGFPLQLQTFLDFDKYEVHGIARSLAEKLCLEGPALLSSEQPFTVTPLELYAVSQRLNAAEPTCDSGQLTQDIGHILDFFNNVKIVKIHGSSQPFESSNIILNELRYDLKHLKSLQTLILDSCNPSNLTGLETLKKTLKKMHVHHSVSYIKDILLQDLFFWETRQQEQSVLVPTWSCLQCIDFSHNNIAKIDESVKLIPRAEILDVSHNNLETVSNLQFLSCLKTIDLSFNSISNLSDLHTKLGNVKVLILAGNLISSLLGLNKLYSLETLDLSNNKISEASEVNHIGLLPCLIHLNLSFNPISLEFDYRVTVLQLFIDRAAEITLDNESLSQVEIDRISVLQAIKKSRGGISSVNKGLSGMSLGTGSGTGTKEGNIFDHVSKPRSFSTYHPKSKGSSPTNRPGATTIAPDTVTPSNTIVAVAGSNTTSPKTLSRSVSASAHTHLNDVLNNSTNSDAPNSSTNSETLSNATNSDTPNNFTNRGISNKSTNSGAPNNYASSDAPNNSTNISASSTSTAPLVGADSTTPIDATSDVPARS